MAKKSSSKKPDHNLLLEKTRDKKHLKISKSASRVSKAKKTKSSFDMPMADSRSDARKEILSKNKTKGVLPLKVMKPSKQIKTDVAGWRKLVSDAGSASDASLHDTSEFAAQIDKRLSKSNPFSIHHLENASTLLAIAAGIAVLLGAVMVFLPGGNDAVPAMGGVLNATVPLQTAQVTFLLDVLFPITFGAGLALLANTFQTRGNRPIVRMILTALLFAILADFSENALVFKALIGGETHAVQWPLTVIKYAMLGLAAVLLSSVMVKNGMLGDICLVFLRYVFPVSIAILVAGIGGRTGSTVIGAGFPVGLLLLAIYARTLPWDKKFS